MPETAPHLFSDLSLSRRLERTEAQSNIEFVEARGQALPESHAQWLDVGGAYAMFDGVDSPLTQTFGLGMTRSATATDLERIETFFTRLGAPVFHEVSPLADASVLPLLNERQYEPFEFTSVMFQALGGSGSIADSRPGAVRARRVEDDEIERWAQTMSDGWRDTPGLGDFMLDFSRVSARRASGFAFLAEHDGKAIAAGGLTIHEGVALLAGASTVPEGRRLGAQKALLHSRLSFAVGKGCDVAMMCALPGSASQRNAERQGFQIAYTRAKWRQKTKSA